LPEQTNGWVSGWRTPTLSGGMGRWKGIGLATFRVDCLAIRETERYQYDTISLAQH
jgi:hypothetical protein